MYRPAHFEENRTEVLHALMQAHPLAQLVTHGTDGLDANPLPFELDSTASPHGTLRAHVARTNPVWQHAADTEVLVIFQAAGGYISPNWYPSKPEHHRHVPTWNYQVAHAHGVLRVRDDERFLRGLVGRLTREHEQRSQQERPWRMSDSAPDFIDGMLKAIVGIEIEITRLVGKFKLGQNREARDLEGAAAGLDALGQHDIARAMRATRDPS
ncbi:FMN-binding negative transcriptional regulator [Hydrogenophaga sp. RWCD_12]|uniref:FMN-binding negative transcriptional regulator n=1 Tax=Hydrogenophaga sp. RWCD_12 TaxID=3391190 RepID=UPI0039849246